MAPKNLYIPICAGPNVDADYLCFYHVLNASLKWQPNFRGSVHKGSNYWIDGRLFEPIHTLRCVLHKVHMRLNVCFTHRCVHSAKYTALCISWTSKSVFFYPNGYSGNLGRRRIRMHNFPIKHPEKKRKIIHIVYIPV